MFIKKIFNHSVKKILALKNCLILFGLLLLTNCGQYSAMIGPSYALLESGSVLQATSSYGRSYLVSSAKKSYTDEINPQRICQELHSSELRSIFFETQDKKGCIYDPLSVYRWLQFLKENIINNPEHKRIFKKTFKKL